MRKKQPTMRAVILAGGKGTRLAPYTTVFPKALMPVGDMPVLELLVRSLVKADISRITLAVGHLSSLIEAYFGDGSKLGAEIDYSHEEAPTGTAGPLRLVKGLSDTFLVMNGDLLTDLDFGAMIDAHRQSDAEATVGIYRRSVHIDLGVVETDEQHWLLRYTEKPVHHYLVSMGAYVLEPGVLELIPERRFDLPELVAAMVDDGRAVNTYEHLGDWLDIGSPDDYAQAQADAGAIIGHVLG